MNRDKCHNTGHQTENREDIDFEIMEDFLLSMKVVSDKDYHA